MGDDVRGGTSKLQFEGFNVNGAIAAVYIGTFAQRNGETRPLRRRGRQNQKRSNSKYCGERDMHLAEGRLQDVTERVQPCERSFKVRKFL
jgi:hypothetical protein